MKKINPVTTIRVRAEQVIEDCIESGLNMGWNRAHKHEDSPAQDTITSKQLDAIMELLYEKIDFGGGDDE